MYFTIDDIPDFIIDRMIQTSVWTTDCPVAINKLKLLKIIYYNFDGEIMNGEIIVLDKLARSALFIFEELFLNKFPIHSVRIIDELGGDDDLSMKKNNSSCFNFRTIAGTDKLSIHSYGAAIDINPVQNPYIVKDAISKKTVILPAKASEFLDRKNQRAGMVEPIVNIFYKHGFTEWGGSWTDPVDYHHFQVPRNKIEELIL